MRLIGKIRAILFPIFNWGQAALILILVCVLGLIAIYSDALSAMYVGVGAYVGMVVHSFLLGLAPDEIAIEQSEVGPISMMLNSEPLIEPIGEGVWAPSRYKSSLWKSDRISIIENRAGEFCLKARRRDLKLILARLRREGS